jgi:hypothetical protein
MASAIVAVVGSLLGVALGFVLQYWQHRWHLADLKREAYKELLRAISASYHQACSGGDKSEDANILKARAVIELLAEPDIAEATRQLEQQVYKTHEKIRGEGSEAAAEEVDKTDHDRKELIKKFQPDLGIRPHRMRAWWRAKVLTVVFEWPAGGTHLPLTGAMRLSGVHAGVTRMRSSPGSSRLRW